MAVKKGYRQTEVGIMPSDWEVTNLGQLSEFVTSGSRGWAAYYSEHGALFVRSQNVRDGKLDLADRQCVLPPSGAEVSRTRLKKNDLLITVTGNSVGNVARVSYDLGDAYVSQHVGLVRLIKPSVAEYVCRFLAPYSPGNAQIWASQSGQSKPGLKLTDLHEFVVALPPTFTEQEAIAGALSDAEAWIESLEQLIAKKRQIKQGAMQELLTGKRRLPGFSGKWETKRLGEFLVSHPQYGINAAAVSYSDRLPAYIRITDITEYGQYAPNPRVSVDARDVTDYFLADGDLVFARTGASVGKSYRYRLSDGPLVFAGFLIRIRPIDQFLNPRFLEGYVTSEKYWNWVRLMSMRSGQPGINGKEYAQLPIELPSIEEQTAIATVLSDMDTEIESLDSKLAKAREVKQGMMQELLTGRIRLV